MIVKYIYSHLNGLEWLKVHKLNLWEEIIDSIQNVDSGICKTKISQEKTMRGKVLFSPQKMNSEIKKELDKRGWCEKRINYYVTEDENITSEIINFGEDDQKKTILSNNLVPIHSY